MKTCYMFMLAVFVAFTASAQQRYPLPVSENFSLGQASYRVNFGPEWSITTTSPASPSGGAYLAENNGKLNSSELTLDIDASDNREIKVSWYERRVGNGNSKDISRTFSYTIGENTVIKVPASTAISTTWTLRTVTLDADADSVSAIQLRWSISTQSGNDKFAIDDVRASGKSIKFLSSSLPPSEILSVTLGADLGMLAIEKYIVSATNLLTQTNQPSTLIITASPGFQVSLNDYEFGDFVQVVPNAAGTIYREIYIQYEGSDIPGVYTGKFEHAAYGIKAFLDVYGITSDIPVEVQPVELATFQGQSQNGTTKLAWTTASETNNEKFLVERSKDGKSFSVLGEVKGSGNSTTRRNYSFTDNAPAGGTNYYRLRQVDYDGTESYSNVVALEVAGGSIEASVYPTVASSKVTISLPDAAGNTTINVVDATGRPVATISNTNERKIELPVHSLKSGMYFVRVTNGSSQQVKRFIKE